MGTGLDNGTLPPDMRGIVPRAIQDMFERMEAKQKRNLEGYKYSVAVSFLELYNEDLVDLLNPRPRTAGSNSGPTIREDSNGNIVWSGVREEEVVSPEELLRLVYLTIAGALQNITDMRSCSCLQRGTLCRTTGSTDMNASSSRSHAIFSVILRQQAWIPALNEENQQQDPNSSSISSDEPNTTTTDPLVEATDINDEEEADYNPTNHPNGQWRHTVSKFHFVDLAGSERLKRTNAEGDRKKEGISINQGLLALGNVISALGDENKKGAHVPYRDSKLTRMLQDSLGGNSQTLMLACVSPSDLSYGETVNTLVYANRARNIKNRVLINQEFAGGAGANAALEKEVRSLRTLVAELREEVSNLKGGGKGSVLGEQAFRRASFMEDQDIMAADMVASQERQMQLQMQEQRDLLAKLSVSNAELKLARFDVDRLRFRSNRLKERVTGVNEELMTVMTERDAAVIELERYKSGRVHPTVNITPGSPQHGSSTDHTVSPSKTASDRPAPDVSLSMVASYNRTISDLRFRLAEANDRLAWYNEAVAMDGKLKPKPKAVEFDPTLDTPTQPQIQNLLEEQGLNPEVSHERHLLKAIQSNPEVGQVRSFGTCYSFLSVTAF
jgi:hypothetical protein